MRQNKTLFFAIIGLAIIVVVGMFAGVYFFADSLNLPTGQPTVAIRVVVAPSIKPWADQAAQSFNQANPKTQIEIIEADSLIPESQFSANPQVSPPAAWLAEATFVVDMARNGGLPFDDARPVAGTSLAWGAFADKQEKFTQQYGTFGWESIHAKAVAPDDFLTVVIASPRNTAGGLAALVSATAAHLNTETLSGAEVNQATPWLTETFKDNTRILPTPAEAFATAQGRSIGDAGLLPVAAWHRAGLQDRAKEFAITPAQPDVTLDYPFAILTGSQATPEGQQAAAAFRDFLLSEPQQNALAGFSFDRAGLSPAGVQADGAAALALFRWAERELRQ